MNSNSRLFFFHSFDAVCDKLVRIDELMRFYLQRTGSFSNVHFLVLHDTLPAVCKDRVVLKQGDSTGMLFSVLAMPVATVNRTKEKNR